MVNYYNATAGIGSLWAYNSSTIATGAAFTVEAQSSTNFLVIRNFYIPVNGTTGFASVDLWILDTNGGTTASIAIASGQVNSLLNYNFLISSTHMLRVVNNSGSTHAGARHPSK